MLFCMRNQKFKIVAGLFYPPLNFNLYLPQGPSHRIQKLPVSRYKCLWKCNLSLNLTAPRFLHALKTTRGKDTHRKRFANLFSPNFFLSSPGEQQSEMWTQVGAQQLHSHASPAFPRTVTQPSATSGSSSTNTINGMDKTTWQVLLVLRIQDFTHLTEGEICPPGP